ncbi:BCSC C-terminal domain-containing protein [Enterobacteriaceae bacterium EKM102V]|uniref:cellulose biosynthesis protein BcsC n=1 Tax=Pantoea TaxID=53335 RepID=UPI00142E7A7B|nr:MULTISPECIES: cellulose biosynthesis protein BcsC [Pantoea]KAF6658521.1 BCSC C-terminal domain-containing protein [Enterobacteriaceae bacterium EKM102V]KAF6667133.1 BCSC C-terminal domain-containing protein [Pantoea sp. EKM103V]
MNTTLISAGIRHALLLGSTLIFSSPLLAAESSNPALQALFDQASYWHQKAHDDLAKASLQKVLMVEPGNTQALYLLALYSQQGGDTAAAAQYRARLSQVAPGDPHLSELDNARQMQTIPQAQLSLARQQARSGNIPAALQTWRNTFSGNEPPASVAAEYYLTMAGDRTLLPQAVEALRQFAAQHPQDTGAQLALGKALTYQESTRREGIEVLSALASGNQDADRSLRQALLWLGPQPADAARYQTWQQRHPQDTAVMDYYRKNVGGAEKGAGFSALNSGDVGGAQASFEKVLGANPQDADALAGMGYVAQRDGRYQEAADYLQRAAQLGGDQSASRQQQAEDARFYAQLASAQQALKNGDSAQALTLSEPLMQAQGEKGLAARLFRADVLRRTNQPVQAEQIYREILQSDADNRSAKEGLFYVLRQQNRTAEAGSLLGSLPESVRQSVAPRANEADALRQQAKRQLAAGNSAAAMATLQQAIQRYPTEGWLRLDLARLYRQQGDTLLAANVMQPVMRSGASSSELYAGALNASESGGWQQASTLLSRIPASAQTAAMRELAQRVNFNLQMSTADRYLAQGATAAAANTLKALTVNPPANPVDAGNLAQKLAQAGDLPSAVSLVRANLQRGVQGNAGDYAAQMAVLNQAGLGSEAQRFLSNPELQARSTPTQLAGIRNGYLINEVDRLRQQRQYAVAYDKLIGALQQDPQNRDLMFAMARLYQDGKMNRDAGVVYDYLMTQDTPTQDARVGAINVALAQNDVQRASALSRGLNRTAPSADRLLLLARVAEANGDHTQAMGYLRSARGQLIGLQGAQPGSVPTIGGLALADNPFINRHTSPVGHTASSYGTVLPWQAAPAGVTAQGEPAAGSETASRQAQTLHEIDTMMDSLQEKTGTWSQGMVQVRGRDGESGLSKLTEAKAPLTFSTVPFEKARFDFTATPVSLTAGSGAADAWRRFGTNALSQGNVVAAGGATVNDLPNATTDSQTASGVELNLALKGDRYKVDLGSTPLGQDLSTLVGGVQWSPKLTDFLTLILTGERRAITDSLLSYVGAEDKSSGKRWGRVTKNGANALLSYDNGDAGFYAGAGAYSYLGENVASNNSLQATAGAYVRPFHSDDRELKVGMSLSWMDFSKNLSYFSYGQGGYFSPQNYAAVSFPVEFSRRFNDLKVNIGGSAGYQSYSQDKSAYFPADARLQSQLEALAAGGSVKEAYYSGGSKNGVGYNLHAGADYKLNKDVTIGGQLGYDTFGDYNESSAQLYVRYLFGEK